ncbi:hypothetical protein ACX8XP_03730 [Calditrichota bacterium LG25]
MQSRHARDKSGYTPRCTGFPLRYNFAPTGEANLLVEEVQVLAFEKEKIENSMCKNPRQPSRNQNNKDFQPLINTDFY